MSASNNFLFQTIDFSEFGGLFAFLRRFCEDLLRERPTGIYGGNRFSNCTAERLADTLVMQNNPKAVVAHILSHFGSHNSYDRYPLSSSFGHAVRIAERETDTIVVDYVFVVKDQRDKVALEALNPYNADAFFNHTLPIVLMGSVRVHRTDAQHFEVEKYCIKTEGNAWRAVDMAIGCKHQPLDRKLIENVANAIEIASSADSLPLPKCNAGDLVACTLFIFACAATLVLLFAF